MVLLILVNEKGGGWVESAEGLLRELQKDSALPPLGVIKVHETLGLLKHLLASRKMGPWLYVAEQRDGNRMGI